jgi:hypothetical protein
VETFYQILAIIAAVAVVFLTYRTIKSRPELFSKELLSKSFMTMGILGLLLIGFVAVLVLLLRSG